MPDPRKAKLQVSLLLDLKAVELIYRRMVEVRRLEILAPSDKNAEGEFVLMLETVLLRTGYMTELEIKGIRAGITPASPIG